MSQLTHLIVLGNTYEPGMLKLNSYTHPDCLFSLVSIDDNRLPRHWYGGTKVFAREMWVGCLNNFDLDDFLVFLGGIDWELPEVVQVVVCGEDDEKFQLIDVFSK